MKKHNGFTLIELMIVVAIIGTLTAISYPSYKLYLNKAGRSDAKEGLARLHVKQGVYYNKNNVYTTSLADLGASTFSLEGSYSFAITSDDPRSGYVLTASAVLTESQGDDLACPEMTLSSTGVKTPSECW